MISIIMLISYLNNTWRQKQSNLTIITIYTWLWPRAKILNLSLPWHIYIQPLHFISLIILIYTEAIINSKTFFTSTSYLNILTKILLILSSKIISKYVISTQSIILWKSLIHISLDYCHGIKLLWSRCFEPGSFEAALLEAGKF